MLLMTKEAQIGELSLKPLRAIHKKAESLG